MSRRDFDAASVKPVPEMIRERLEMEGAKVQISDLENDQFVQIDGEGYFGQTHPYADAAPCYLSFEMDPQAFYEERVPMMGTYSSNNGVVAFVDKKGVMCVAIKTPSFMKALEEAGFQESSFSVQIPMSNLEHFVRPETEKRWQKISSNARIEFDRIKLENQKMACQQAAQDRGVKIETSNLLANEESNFMKVDGVVYVDSYDTSVVVIPSADELSTLRSRESIVGCYAINQGVVAFVDSEGSLYVGPSTQANQALLREAGYNDSQFFVPFSNGGHAVSWSIHLYPESENGPLRVLDSELIGDMQDLLGTERDPQSIVDWYREKFVPNHSAAIHVKAYPQPGS